MSHDSRPISRRRALAATSALGALAFAGSREALADPGDELPAPIRALAPLPGEAPPIGLDEHKARVARAQALVAESGLDAIVIGPGSR